MACIIACASSLVSAVCDRLLGSTLNEVDRGTSFLLNLAGTEIWNRLVSRWNAVLPISNRTTSIVGGEETLRTIRDYLTDDNVDVVGIYGMGGVGKTALLNEVNNDLFFKGPGKFDIVIYATVSSTVDVLNIQREIQSRLGLQSTGGDNPALLRRTLFEALSKKRFLLLLDDVWGELDLEQLGIPLPDHRNKCKVVITTRSEEVYGQIVGTWCNRKERARKVRVAPLDEVRSWELFCQKVDVDVDLDDPSIQPEAKKIVHKCGGLPLALVTVGRAMATARRPELWSRAVTQLEEYSAYKIEGMPTVHTNLQFSVDRLESQTLRSCFLYCALFPEDQSVPEEQLIEYWIGEGYLDDGGEEPPRCDGQDLRRSRAEGYFVIEKLKSACLLEGSSCRDFRDGEKWVDAVKMHDVIRDTALRLARMDPDRFLVGSGHRRATFGRTVDDATRASTASVTGVERWEEATKISFIHSTVEDAELPEMPNCPRLSTLLMNEVEVPRELPDWFFAAMPALVVLDLSKACVVTSHSWGWAKRFQISICLLTELRYLNLSRIVMPCLPKELGNLRNLRHLDLSDTSLQKIPHESISRLSALQVLNMHRSNYRWSWEWSESSDDDEEEGKGWIYEDERALSLKDLQNLDRLEELSLDLRCLDSLSRGLLPSRTLLRSTACLRLVEVCGLTADHLSEALGQMGSLRELQIRECPHLYGELILEGGSDGRMTLGQLETLVLWRLPVSAILVRAGGGGERRRGGGGSSASSHLPLEKLKRLFVGGCDGLKDLRWVAQHRSLQLMNVYSCRGMEGLAVAAPPRAHHHGGQAASEEQQDVSSEGGILPKLTRLNLNYLPRLRSICGPGRHLPSLEYLWVTGCPQLRRIPLGSPKTGGSTTVKRIDGEQKWWDHLSWEPGLKAIHVTAQSAFEPIAPGQGGSFGGYEVAG